MTKKKREKKYNNHVNSAINNLKKKLHELVKKKNKYIIPMIGAKTKKKTKKKFS
jgi:hypothetical protein